MRTLAKRLSSPVVAQRLALLAAVGMFLVIVQGSLVTNTGSKYGCGNSWPLCNGKFVPQMAVTTAIEYSHRLVVSIETVLIVLAAAGALWHWRQRVEVRVLAPLMVVFLFAQAALGAAAVKWPQSEAVLALHFGVSLIAFASALLVAVFVRQSEGEDRLRDRPAPRGVVWAVWGLLLYSYFVVYLGAYVNQSKATLACPDWPLCNDQLYPGLGGLVGVAFGHRAAAALLLGLSMALLWWTARRRAERPDLFRGALLAFVFVMAQALSGAFVVLTRLDVFATMAHSMLVALFFGTLSYMGLQVLPRPAAARTGAPIAGRGDAALRPRAAPGSVAD